MDEALQNRITAGADAWRTDGWTLIEGFIPADEIERARAELPTELVPADETTRPSRHRANGRSDPDDHGPAFRNEQFSGTALFPIAGASSLNRLFVHPRMTAFAEAALATDDIRIHQSRVWSKRAGLANYEQPLHRDLNHSLVPTRSEPGFWHLECFLYLTDVELDTGAPRLVPRSLVEREPHPPRPQRPDDAPELYRAEVSAVGCAGSLLAYRSDVWHRGIDLERPDAERHVLVVSYKPAGVEWIGYDSHPPLAVNADFNQFVGASTPRELALFGFPAPGHPYWTDETLNATAAQYPDLDLEPWRKMKVTG